MNGDGGERGEGAVGREPADWKRAAFLASLRSLAASTLALSLFRRPFKSETSKNLQCIFFLIGRFDDTSSTLQDFVPLVGNHAHPAIDERPKLSLSDLELLAIPLRSTRSTPSASLLSPPTLPHHSDRPGNDPDCGSIFW